MTAVQRLPGGRRATGGLTREQVSEHQRERLLMAMAGVVAEKGYAATTVGDVITSAGVSRATFYEQFADKQECFLAAFDAASDRVLAATRPGRGATFSDVLAAYLDALVADAAFAKVFLVEIYAVGPAGMARRAAGQRRFTDAVARAVGARSAADRFACEAFVAAVGSMVTTRLAAGDLDGLRALHAPLTDLAARLLP